MLTPVDILNQEFRKSLRGYNEDEVDAFLEKVGRDYERLYRENLDLKEQLQQKDNQLQQYRQLEETLQNTLVLAQKSSDDLKRNAEKEADLILREARAKAEEMVAQAGKKMEKLLQEYEALQRQLQVYKTQLRSFLKAQLELVDAQPESVRLELAAAQEEDKVV
ncbi:MAG: DivIVA domain-containing protein [Firmicutes bacterium]|nr:DivIVA domain-containing protein [Bacillota bacterium]